MLDKGIFMRLILQYKTNVGTFYIGQSDDGRFHPIFNNESLGSYDKIWQATEDLAIGTTLSVLHPETNEFIDTSEIDIPYEPSEWEKLI